ncbi:MAG: HD domain-containing protein [Oscillospiraceae bacterium]|nr:HD domain-containing protein [Oscillospiraceae bacterium]
MNQKDYSFMENYMLSCMEDSAHDKEHIYRVLYNALEIAEAQKDVDFDVLIGACLLHDIGRKEQFEDPSQCHAQVGAEKAYRFLSDNGFEKDYAEKIRHCIQTHRFRKNNPPQSIEAKILFDADKLDVAGALGIARTLIYKGIVTEPLYSLLPDGSVSNGENDTSPSFFQEYKYKLENIYSKFYTQKGKELALNRQHSALAFYEDLFNEVSLSYKKGKSELEKLIKND